MPENNAKLAIFLTFADQAEAAMNFYQKLFRESERVSLTRIDDNLPLESVGQSAGKVLNGQLKIKGQLIMFMDLAPAYATPFSWASSIYVDCDDETEFDQLFSGFSEGGSVMMGPEPVFELRKVAWVTDQFGVTWQLVWA